MASTRTTKAELRDETKLLADLTELWHERGLSLTTRTVYVGSESVDGDSESGVDGRLAERVLKNLLVLESISDQPIRLLMNNLGGSDYHGLAIIDAIERSACEVHCIVRGAAMSMGSWILQACDKRVMGPRATQMAHLGGWQISGNAADVKRDVAENQRIERMMHADYLHRIREKHPHYSALDLDKLLERDSYLNAQDSLALGLVDEIA